jgi:hypothetical protein
MTASDTDNTKPGFYPGLDFDLYRAIPATNNGSLKWLDITPSHYRACVDGLLPDDDSAAKRFGRALHCRLLEPTLFAERFIIGGQCGALLKSGERKGEPCGAPGKYQGDDGTWFCGSHSGNLPEPTQDVLSDADAAMVEGAARSVKNHAVVDLLRKQGGFECSAVAEIDGLLCKGRFDKWIPGKRGTILDIKKVQVGKATYQAFQRTLLPGRYGMGCYGYAMQSHLYQRIAEALTGAVPRFLFIVVEDGPPFGVQVFEVDSTTDTLAGHELKLHLQTIKLCEQSGVWPGYVNQAGKPDVQSIGVPEWYIRQAEQAGVNVDE